MNGVLPVWVVVPPAAALLLMLAAWVGVASRHVEPASRRRIRVASAWVLLATIPLCAAGFCMIDPNVRPREFVLAWSLVIGLLMVTIALAGLDIVNTLRLRGIARRRLAVDGRLLEHRLREARGSALPGAHDEPRA